MKNGGILFVVTATSVSMFFMICIYLLHKPSINAPVSNAESLVRSDKDIVEMSEWDHIADATRRCLLDNNIKVPQSEREMAQLLVGNNKTGTNYITGIKGLSRNGDSEFCDLAHDLHYTVSFDGKNILLHEPNLERPVSIPLNGSF